MKKSDFLREHKHLIKLLDTGKKFITEANAQKKELKKYIWVLYMPYKVIPSGSGYVVEDIKSHRKFSKHPLSKEQARKQQIAIALSEIRRHPKKDLASLFKW